MGKDVLKKECLWLIGNGESINKWIPGCSSLSQFQVEVSKKVSDLLIPNSISWNIVLISFIFRPFLSEKFIRVKFRRLNL